MKQASRIIFTAVALLAATLVNFSQTDAEKEQIRRFRDIVMRPVVYKIPGMEKVKVIADIDYAKSGSQYRKMDVYLPPNVTKNDRLPAVIFIHGGTSEQFTPKDWGIYTSWGRLVAASGMAAVTFTHRLGFPKTALNEGASDVESAISYVRTNADALNVDKDRLCLIAFSAGGPMLSTAMREKPAYIRCLVAYYAFMDVQQSEAHRQSETPETVKKFSNITYLSSPDADRIPPLLIARAGRDEVPTMLDSIDRFIREALSRNIAVTVVNHPNGVHGFDNQSDDERSREIIRQTIEFMKMHLGSKETLPTGNSASIPTESNGTATADPNGPGVEQKLLAELTGTWNYKLKIFMGPKAAPVETDGIVIRQPILNGRFLSADFSVRMLPGASGKLQEVNFRGKSIDGYDDVKHKYVSTWIDNMSTGITVLEGDYDSALRTFTYRGTNGAERGKEVKVREVVRIIDQDHYTLDWYEDRGRGETKTVEISYTRQI